MEEIEFALLVTDSLTVRTYHLYDSTRHGSTVFKTSISVQRTHRLIHFIYRTACNSEHSTKVKKEIDYMFHFYCFVNGLTLEKYSQGCSEAHLVVRLILENLGVHHVINVHLLQIVHIEGLLQIVETIHFKVPMLSCNTKTYTR